MHKFIKRFIQFRLTFFLLFISIYTQAQWIQLGNKLVGTGNIGFAQQGQFVSISANGQVAIVGGNRDNSSNGAVWVYTYNGNSFVQFGNKLVATGNIGAAGQGSSVCISADAKTIIVGGTSDNSNIGAVWIYTFDGNNFIQVNKLVGTDNVGASLQGIVGISGDGKTVVVGGIADNSGIGAVWIYTYNGSNFVQMGEKLVANDFIGAANQGISVSISTDGKTIIVGGYLDNSNIGAAWIYTFNGHNFVQAGNKLVGTGSIGNAEQGRSVSISGDGKTAIVGGYFDNSNIGAAWIFTFNGSNFVQAGNKIVGTGSIGSPLQGESVNISTDGKTVVVGGRSDNFAGATWIYTFDGNSFVQAGDKLVGSGYSGPYTTWQGLATSITADGKTVLVGGVRDDTLKGAAWVFVNTSLGCDMVTITGTSPDVNVCVGSTVLLSVNATGSGLLTYQWYQNNTLLGTSYSSRYDIPSISSANAGSYFCVATNACGTATSTGINVTVTPIPTVTGSVFPGPVCIGNPVTITGSGASILTISGAIILGTGFIPTISGTYTLSGATNGCTDTTIVNVTVNSLPHVGIGGNDTICVGVSTFIYPAYGTGNDIFHWSNGATTSTIVVSPPISTTYVLTVTDANGCVDSASVLVVVNKLAPLSISGNNIICQGDYTSFTVNGANTYSWSNGLSSTVIGVNPGITTTYLVTGTGINNCENIDSVIVVVNNLPVLTISDNQTICSGFSTILTASGAKFYNWSNGSTDSTNNVSPTSSIAYVVTGTGANGCLNTALTNITVNSLPNVSLDLSSINQICNTVGSIALTEGKPIGGTYEYSGSIVDSLNISKGGEYPIIYQYMDSNLCKNTASDTLSVVICLTICEKPNPPCYCTNTCPPPFKIYTAITPNGDGLNDTWYIDSLQSDTKVTILDKWGNEVFSTNNYSNDWDGKHNGKELPAGIYYYVLEISQDKKRISGTVSVIR